MASNSTIVGPASPIVTPSLSPTGSVEVNGCVPKPGMQKRTSSPRVPEQVTFVTNNRYQKPIK